MQSLDSATPSSDAPVPAAALMRTREFLTFNLGAEEYGIDILKVQEIRCYEKPTRIANAPDFIKGVVNLRGIIVPIVDLRIKFDLPDGRVQRVHRRDRAQSSTAASSASSWTAYPT